jgi:uncharacterized membrane protein
MMLRTPRVLVVDVYPLIPWVGVAAVGYGLGQIYRWPTDRRKAFLLRTGAAVTAGFIVLRAINLYGDPVRWSSQKSVAFTVLSFLNTTKYPPSRLYLLMTLGPALLLLWAIDGKTPRWLQPALIVGKVPMFYYLVHIPLIHLLTLAVSYARYGQVRWAFRGTVLFSSAIRMGILFANHVSGVGLRRACALSTVPVVCRLEATSQRCLAQLFLNGNLTACDGRRNSFK